MTSPTLLIRDRLSKAETRRWDRKLRHCPVGRSAAGYRWIRLPNGTVYSKHETDLASMLVDELARRSRDQRWSGHDDRRLLILRKLVTADEYAAAEEIVEQFESGALVLDLSTMTAELPDGR